MKEVSKAIRLCLKTGRESIAPFIRNYPKLKDLSLENYGNSPLGKAAYTLHYFFVDNDDSQYDAPIEVIPGILLYLKGKNIEFKNLEKMYNELNEAFKSKKPIDDIEMILQKHINLNE